MSFTKPIIKWVGGKTQIIDKIMEIFPNEINNYHELFLGGGSVLIALLEMQKNNNIKINGSINAYDINETLINMYKNIQKEPRKIIAYIKKLIKFINNLKEEKGPRNIKSTKDYKDIKSKESFYYWLRYKYNKYSQNKKNSYKGSSMFIFLNKTCFRGLYREGPNGFNVPYGHYNNPEVINKEHIMNISELIKNVNFIHSDFSKSFDIINNNIININDFIYLDPPYAPINDKSFVDYNADGFNLDKHKKLFELIKTASNNNVRFIMSNADVSIIRETFEQYNIMTILCKRSINSKNPESKVNEVLIKNFS
jgi:DNA adenine methylase